MLTVECIDSEALLDTMREPWNALLRRSEADTIFLTWEWASSWWRRFGGGQRQLFVLVVKDGRDYVAIAPWVITHHRLRGHRTLKRIEFLGSEVVNGEYLDLIVSPGTDMRSVAGVIVERLEGGHGDWDLIHLDSVPETSVSALIFAAAAKDGGYRVARQEQDICPYVSLPRSWDEMVRQLPKGLRKNFQYQMRSLRRKFEIDLVRCDREKIGEWLEVLFDLHARRWGTKGERGSFTADRKREFYRDVCEHFAGTGWLRFYALTVNGAPAAVLLGFSYGGTFTYLQSGFDPEWAKFSMGQVLLAKVFEQAIEEGCGAFDFLRGPEEYKHQWGARDRRTIRMEISQVNIKMKIFHTLRAAGKPAAEQAVWEEI